MQQCDILVGEGGVGYRGRFLCRRSPEEAAHSSYLPKSPSGSTWTDPPLPCSGQLCHRWPGLAWVSTRWISVFFPAVLLPATPSMTPQRSQHPPLGAGSCLLCSESEAPAAQTGRSLPGDLPALKF